MSVLFAWATANQVLIATTLFALSEAIGANSKVKSNGILSFLLIHANEFLKKKGAKDLTP